MEGESIFNKIEELGNTKSNTQEASKESVIDGARKEIQDIESQKEKLIDLQNRLDEKKGELKLAKKDFDEAFQTLLPIFEDEEKKKMMGEQGIENVSQLVEKYGDTAEVKKLVDAENRVAQNIEELKNLKKEIEAAFEIDSESHPDRRSLQRLSQLLYGEIRQADADIYQLSADTPEGREKWALRYPSGAFHKESEKEKEIKEKEPQIRELYHSLGDVIDAKFEESIEEYNKSHTEEPIKNNADFVPGRHRFSRSDIRVEGDGILLQYGGGYSALEFEIKKNNTGQWFINRKKSWQAIQSEAFVSTFNKKMKDIDAAGQSLLGKLN